MGRKVLISFIFVIIFLCALSTSVFASEITLNLKSLRGTTEEYPATGRYTGPFSYIFKRNKYNGVQLTPVNFFNAIWKIYDTSGVNRTIYCLNEGVGFTEKGSTGIIQRTYNYSADIKNLSTEDRNLFIDNEADYNSIKWLINNMYLKEHTNIAEKNIMRNNLLSAAFKDMLEDETYYPRFQLEDIFLTDDDIDIVQQLALWTFTNNEEFSINTTTNKEIFPIIHVLENEELIVNNASTLAEKENAFTELIGIKRNVSRQDGSTVEIPEGNYRTEHMIKLYDYLVTTARANSTSTNSSKAIVKIDKTLTQTITQTSLNDYLMGPFKIDNTNNGDMTNITINATLKGISENSVENAINNFGIVNASGNLITGVRNIKDAVGKGNFYLLLPKNLITEENIKSIKFNITVEPETITTATFWTNKTSGVEEQPVVIIEKILNEDNAEIQLAIPIFDLALRKSIIRVNGTAINESRIPNIVIDNLNNKTETTAEYKHKKDPVEVTTGDKVQYTLTVYNEGEIEGRATKIVDQLPTGLKFLRVVVGNYELDTYDEVANRLTLKETVANTDLGAFNGHILRSTSVIIECEVTQKVSGIDNILTNVAWISEDTNLNNIKDRDSEPATTPNVNKDNMENYKGNAANKEDLTDSTYHYKGIQDDDDFEKLIIKGKEFDLALRKSIIKVNDTAVNESRIPNIVVDNLINKTETTAEYKHKKDPVEVTTGDKVQYTLTVYNEGEIEGRATKLVDLLPTGLEFLRVVAGNYELDTYDEVENILTLKETVANTDLEAFDGNVLKSASVIIECEVVATVSNSDQILTNIAWISEDVNSEDLFDRDSEPENTPNENKDSIEYYIGNIDNKGDLTDSEYYYKGEQDDDDFEKLILKGKEFDLALRKSIIKVNDTAVNESRIPNIVIDNLNNKTDTTAEYKHKKDPVEVETGDTVQYELTIYNEGETEGRATKIADQLPTGLKFEKVISGDYVAKIEEYDYETTNLLILEKIGNNNLAAFDGVELDYETIIIECKVIAEISSSDQILTNVAWIDEVTNTDNLYDRDSEPENTPNVNKDNMENYKGHTDNKEDLTDSEYHYKGEQDDDDFEKLIIIGKEFDLALRKFITKVNSEIVTNRIPKFVIENDQYKYVHTKDPVKVKNAYLVEYTLRIYNEGDIDGYANIIKDNIPEGLEYVPDNETNIDYMWQLSDDAKKITTTFLSETEDVNNIIKAFDRTTMTEPDFKDVKVVFKVIEPNTSNKILINIAEIADDSDDDIDSTPDNDIETEDDIDKEYLKLEYYDFDLALRKFITKVNNTEVTDRVPVFSKQDNKYVYNHKKTPVEVANNDIVEYTLRIYNEGQLAGFADEIKDDVPVGLEFLPDNETNTKYEWTQLKDGTIRTTFLSKEKSLDNEILAFDPVTMAEPAFKEVKVAFKVIEPNTSDRILINTAEISKDNNEFDQDDIDSKPDNNIETEDDIDKEYLKVKYFDLALLKYVSSVIVIEDGKETKTDTGYTGLENPEPIVKVDLHKKKLKTTTVKYIYSIKITNEGEIGGYATEISDYIPEGLEFIKTDNPKWEEKDGKVTTDQLKDTYLKPGESAVVTITLRWINDANNLGLKRNVAEISADKNDSNSKDIDSTPNNKVEGEDDIDEALVILTIKTGEAPQYIVLTTGSIGILAIGLMLIKKYII